MTDQADDKPKIVAYSAKFEMLVTALRQFGLIAGSVISVSGFIRTRDLAGMINYFQGDQLITASAAIVALATLVWGQYSTWRKKRTAVTIADQAPNSVAVVADLSIWQQVKLKWKGFVTWLKSLLP